MPFTKLAANTHAALSSLAAAAKTVHPTDTKTFTFRTGSLLPGQRPPEVKDVCDWAGRKGAFVYLFRTEADAASLEALHKAFASAKQSRLENRAFARLFDPCKVLYVGSSQDLNSRFKQHLGYRDKGTSSMQLACWASCVDVEVEFIAARYPSTVSPAVLGALEDQLWSELKPMFGRQGRR